LDGFDDAKVPDREHVGPVEAKHQEHLGRPAADSLHARQCLDHVIVGHRIEGVKLQ
jgi:hypothetical protein